GEQQEARRDREEGRGGLARPTREPERREVAPEGVGPDVEDTDEAQLDGGVDIRRVVIYEHGLLRIQAAPGEQLSIDPWVGLGRPDVAAAHDGLESLEEREPR